MSKMKFLLSATAAGLCLSAAGAAQTGEHGEVWTNLGELRMPTEGAHVLTGKAFAIHHLEGVRAELAPFAYQEVSDTPGSELELTNKGELAPVIFSGHVL